MIIGVSESPDVLDTTFPFVPVTRPKSLARSPPARVTPIQSLLSIKIVGPEPVPPSFSPPSVSEKVMLAGWPMAWAPTRNNVQHAMNEKRFMVGYANELWGPQSKQYCGSCSHFVHLKMDPAWRFCRMDSIRQYGSEPAKSHRLRCQFHYMVPDCLEKLPSLRIRSWLGLRSRPGKDCTNRRFSDRQ